MPRGPTKSQAPVGPKFALLYKLFMNYHSKMWPAIRGTVAPSSVRVFQCQIHRPVRNGTTRSKTCSRSNNSIYTKNEKYIILNTSIEAQFSASDYVMVPSRTRQNAPRYVFMVGSSVVVYRTWGLVLLCTDVMGFFCVLNFISEVLAKY